MFISANIINGIAVVVESFLNLCLILLIVRIVLSWVNADPYNPIVRAIYMITDPALDLFRRKLRLYFGGFDFSPIILFALILFLQTALVQSIKDYANIIREESIKSNICDVE